MARKKRIKAESAPVEKNTAEEVVLESTDETVELAAAGLSEEILDEDADELGENELAEFGATNIYTEEEADGFLPESDGEESVEALPDVESVEGTELDAYESAAIEETLFVEEEQLDSIVESILFASDRPVSLASIKMVFKGTNIRTDKIKKALDRLAVELAGARRGVTLEEVPGGYQLRTKVDNLSFITRTLKARQFKLSGPALEVLAIAAYKQPLVKSEIDDIRGVESGHLLRALMEKGLISFEGKSDLPGKPMQYGTTKKFLEIFGLRNLKELPTLSQIDELLPEGMTEEEAKPTLSQITDSMSQQIGSSYSEGEEELGKIMGQLDEINTSSDFFEQEKERQRQKRDAEKAQGIRDAITFGEEVSNRDRNWLTRYDEALSQGNVASFKAEVEPADQRQEELTQKIAEFDAETEEEATEVEGFSADSEDSDDEEHSIDRDMAIDLDADIEGDEENTL